MKKRIFVELFDLVKQQAETGRAYLEFMRVPSMSAGLYVLHAGAVDTQTPHKQDEMYYVVRGRAHMQIGSDDHQLSPGSIMFVEAGAEHCFYDITEELAVLVFFAPAET